MKALLLVLVLGFTFHAQAEKCDLSGVDWSVKWTMQNDAKATGKSLELVTSEIKSGYILRCIDTNQEVTQEDMRLALDTVRRDYKKTLRDLEELQDNPTLKAYLNKKVDNFFMNTINGVRLLSTPIYPALRQ